MIKKRLRCESYGAIFITKQWLYYGRKKKAIASRRTLKDSFWKSIDYVTYRQEKDRECFRILCPLFLTNTAFAVTNAIIQLSICFRYAQARYDIDPSSRSEHIECVSTYRTRQRISKIRASGSISTRCVLKGTTLSR